MQKSCAVGDPSQAAQLRSPSTSLAVLGALPDENNCAALRAELAHVRCNPQLFYFISLLLPFIHLLEVTIKREWERT